MNQVYTESLKSDIGTLKDSIQAYQTQYDDLYKQAKSLPQETVNRITESPVVRSVAELIEKADDFKDNKNTGRWAWNRTTPTGDSAKELLGQNLKDLISSGIAQDPNSLSENLHNQIESDKYGAGDKYAANQLMKPSSKNKYVFTRY